jgi:hypothetical protein
MEHLDTLWKVINAAGTVRDLAQERRTYEFIVTPPVSFYLHTEHASVTIKRWHKARIDVRAMYQASLGWRVLTDQDEVGVYLVAKRRVPAGKIIRAEFNVLLPQSTHLILKLEQSALLLDNVTHTLDIPAPTTSDAAPTVYLPAGDETDS